MTPMTQFDFKQHYGRNLPHLQPPGATLFVTFRLAGSIPKSVQEEWLREKRLLESRLLRRKAIGLALDPDTDAREKLAFQRRWFGKFESLLHANVAGPIWLKDTRVAEIVREALLHRDGRVYRLDGFCIMPNHVHAVFAPSLTEAAARQVVERLRRARDRGRPTQTNSLRYRLRDDDKGSVLAVIMQSLKGYTARKCNLALGRSGQFWQHESFDHIIRDQREFVRVINYVVRNPVKAEMAAHWRDWRWNYCRPSLIEAGLIRG
jgi:REP element-mobilizing transposase RayT